MSLSEKQLTLLQSTIEQITQKPKGILAADESAPTITKRLEAINVTPNEQNRKAYREMLLTTPELNQYISGVILFEETLTQTLGSGQTVSEYLKSQGVVPGIKVDKGLTQLANTEDKITQGLDGLAERLTTYYEQGARFAKWRAVYQIGEKTPSALAIKTNAQNLARYAAICQNAGLVPIVEPEVLLEGTHDLSTCQKVSEKVLQAVFKALFKHKVSLEHIVLKPSMVLPGKASGLSATAEEVANATLKTFYRTVPAAVPTINFLSGGQTPQEATERLNAMNQQEKSHPWNLSFSFSRALQEPCLTAWGGQASQASDAQKAFIRRAKLNSLASVGDYQTQLES